MNLSHVYRRALMLSVAVLLGVTLLAAAVVSLSFAHATARHSSAPHATHVAAPQGASIKGSIRRYVGDEAVPSWDIMAYYVTVRCFS